MRSMSRARNIREPAGKRSLPTLHRVPTSTPTHCPYCALQCGMRLDSPGDAGPVVVMPRDFPTSRGGLCQKGWTAAELLSSPHRLTQPLMRPAKDAPLLPVSWEQALDRIAHEITVVQASHGKNAVAVFGGGGLTNEKAYQ